MVNCNCSVHHGASCLKYVISIILVLCEEFIEILTNVIYDSGMRFFRNFPEIRNFHDLRGHSRGNRRSDLIFMGGGGEVPYILCAR